MSTPTSRQVEEAGRYVAMLTLAAPPGSLLDIRYRTRDRGFARLFLHTSDEHAGRRIARIGTHTDVYIGCAPRARYRGTREDLTATAVIWADCDDRRALESAQAFNPPPTMIVASGTPNHGHAYWSLTDPLRPNELEQANRRLARILAADVKCADPTRILRPPGTYNYKHDPPNPVDLLEHTGLRHSTKAILATLAARDCPHPDSHRLPTREQDPLHQIAPAHYVRLLTGQTPNSEGKIACPFHADRKPSLHVYPTPQQGWTCFGCSTPDGKPLGGDIYTLASRLWGIPAHGKSFLDLQARLDDAFSITRIRKQRLTSRHVRNERSLRSWDPAPTIDR
ncbi:MAG: CHC2 zinc finger domain-containing protein [Solirubrobacteraceae bacterium]